MSSAFSTQLPLDQAFARQVLFAAEIVDAVTLAPVTQGLKVSATGLDSRPILNAGGLFVWLEEGGAKAEQVIVDASKTPYESIIVPPPILPARKVYIELAPRFEYPFARGVSAIRASLVESSPATVGPVAEAQVWLQWVDDTAEGTTWVDAPTRSHTGPNGDFAALLRLTPHQIPRLRAAGSLNVRLRVRRGADMRTSVEFPLAEGRVADALPPFVWGELAP